MVRAPLRAFVRVSVMAAVLCLTSVYARAQTGPTQAAAPVIEPGDALKITVWRAPELSGEFPVGPDGAIVHPLFREIHVGGEPFPVADQRIRSYLAQLQSNPQVSVELLVHISVGGQVGRPNMMNVPANATVAEAIALSGGPTERADLAHVRLVRDGQIQEGDLRLGAKGLAQEQIKSGDEIFVPRHASIWSDYILPGAYIVAPVLQIIAFFRR